MGLVSGMQALELGWPMPSYPNQSTLQVCCDCHSYREHFQALTMSTTAVFTRCFHGSMALAETWSIGWGFSMHHASNKGNSKLFCSIAEE